MKQNFGKWSIKSIILFLIWMIVFCLSAESGQTGGEGFFSNPWLAIPALFAAISGIFAFLTGSISIIKHHQRNVLVFISTLIGFLVLLWCVAEVVFPH